VIDRGPFPFDASIPKKQFGFSPRIFTVGEAFLMVIPKTS
jgi:hypothetical protein